MPCRNLPHDILDKNAVDCLVDEPVHHVRARSRSQANRNRSVNRPAKYSQRHGPKNIDDDEDEDDEAASD